MPSKLSLRRDLALKEHRLRMETARNATLRSALSLARGYLASIEEEEEPQGDPQGDPGPGGDPGPQTAADIVSVADAALSA